MVPGKAIVILQAPEVRRATASTWFKIIRSEKCDFTRGVVLEAPHFEEVGPCICGDVKGNPTCSNCLLES